MLDREPKGTLVCCETGFLVVATDLLIPRSPGPAWDGGARLQPEHLFMPFPGEPVQSYLARLRAMRRHLELLIEAVERGAAARGPVAPPVPVRAGAPTAARPARVLAAAPPLPPSLPPRPRLHVVPAERPVSPEEFFARMPERRDAGGDRRAGDRDRRAGHPDRRRGHPDPRANRVERRAGPRDRRSGRRDRRHVADRRASDEQRDEATTVIAAHGVSPVMVFWSVNIVCWLAVVIVAFVWGVG